MCGPFPVERSCALNSIATESSSARTSTLFHPSKFIMLGTNRDPPQFPVSEVVKSAGHESQAKGGSDRGASSNLYDCEAFPAVGENLSEEKRESVKVRLMRPKKKLNISTKNVQTLNGAYKINELIALAAATRQEI